jgi:hypothetical protein
MAQILKFHVQNFNLNISKDSSYRNIIDYQFSSNLELVYNAKRFLKNGSKNSHFYRPNVAIFQNSLSITN